MPQGTIKAFDTATSEGSLLDDGLRELTFDREAFVASGLRELRIGQRVRFELEGEQDDPRVSHLNIVSL
jgi:cold shock CspA family protein